MECMAKRCFQSHGESSPASSNASYLVTGIDIFVQTLRKMAELPVLGLCFCIRSRHSSVAAAPQVESRAMVIYRHGMSSANHLVPASAAAFAGHSVLRLVSAVAIIGPPSTPPVLSLASLDIAADGVSLRTSLLIRIDDKGRFFLGAWDNSVLESFVAMLCACFCW